MGFWFSEDRNEANPSDRDPSWRDLLLLGAYGWISSELAWA